MSDSLEQTYYELLTRTDHPVFFKDYSPVQDQNSGLNAIFNRIFAKQLVTLKALIDLVELNAFPNSVTDLTIDDWETAYFGFIKAGQPLSDRITQLLIKYNNTFRMDVSSVIKLSESITGLTPTVIRSIAQSGWTLDQSALDVTSVFNGYVSGATSQTYLVIFSDPIDSATLAILDSELTKIEKGGSNHQILAQPSYWQTDKSAFDVNTILE